MLMIDAIKNFAKQFSFKPIIKNESKLKKHKRFIVVGMGGSHLAADLLQTWNPSLDITVHRDYGLPEMRETSPKESLIIASSYSGNTEEVIDAFEKAIEMKLSVVAISIGGKLLELAKKYETPYVQMPDTGIQPRSALGFSFKGLLKIIGEERALEEIGELSSSLVVSDYESQGRSLAKKLNYESQGRSLAKKLKGFVPIIYSSTRNQAIAYTWKIKFNETAKIPAFYNVFPELNHNEMNGFDVKEKTKHLSEKFYFIFLKDEKDPPQIQKRMQVLETLYRQRGLSVEAIELKGRNIFHKIFSSLILADWAGYYSAELYGVNPDGVPLVEEFKKLIS